MDIRFASGCVADRESEATSRKGLGAVTSANHPQCAAMRSIRVCGYRVRVVRLGVGLS
jgi:hypothetical protein